ncbi:DDE-type integrase/transposase/recombinase [Streptomyces sp. BE303]|uniref:DDE-type integrase/transposase/recombinase n=1 Tax=unclassified Streptomyces TaxID=2593676 RepID=UPI003FA7C609
MTVITASAGNLGRHLFTPLPRIIESAAAVNEMLRVIVHNPLAPRTTSSGTKLLSIKPSSKQGRLQRKTTPGLAYRHFGAAAPNMLWSGDVTEIETGGGRLHLATVIDLFSRCLLAYGTAPQRRPGQCLAHDGRPRSHDEEFHSFGDQRDIPDPVTRSEESKDS